MRIFITGATGFVGSAVVPELLHAGHVVVGLARSDEGAEKLAMAGAEAVRGDLKDRERLTREAKTADAVIHAAFDHDFSRLAENCEMDRQAIEAIGAGLAESGKPLIVTSGLPLTPGRAATEDDIPPAGAHGIPRVSEQTAMTMIERGVRAMVVRMPQVHDQVKQGFATYLLDHARKTGLSAYVGQGLNRWPAVHRLDAARLYRLVLERGEAGRRYHAVAEEGVLVKDIAETIGKGLGLQITSLSDDTSAEHFGWLDRIVKMDVPASSVLTRSAPGWQPIESSSFLDDLASACDAAVD
ncbi:SDR family oxidoreductase [Shinella sp.]|uniref:SDR family oxidoreductase n=1 Tax=Shinella sp. TaxID=1870904 RepID=UPI00301D1D57